MGVVGGVGSQESYTFRCIFEGFRKTNGVGLLQAHSLCDIIYHDCHDKLHQYHRHKKHGDHTVP